MPAEGRRGQIKNQRKYLPDRKKYPKLWKAREGARRVRRHPRNGPRSPGLPDPAEVGVGHGSTMHVSLVVVHGKPQGKSLGFGCGEFVFGRGNECHIRPTSFWVSRQH